MALENKWGQRLSQCRLNVLKLWSDFFDGCRLPYNDNLDCFNLQLLGQKPHVWTCWLLSRWPNFGFEWLVQQRHSRWESKLGRGRLLRWRRSFAIVGLSIESRRSARQSPFCSSLLAYGWFASLQQSGSTLVVRCWQCRCCCRPCGHHSIHRWFRRFAGGCWICEAILPTKHCVCEQTDLGQPHQHFRSHWLGSGRIPLLRCGHWWRCIRCLDWKIQQLKQTWRGVVTPLLPQPNRCGFDSRAMGQSHWSGASAWIDCLHGHRLPRFWRRFRNRRVRDSCGWKSRLELFCQQLFL